MANKLNHSADENYTLLPAQADLLEALLEPNDAPYPWNTADPESEAYFADQEQDFLHENCFEEEMAMNAQNFLTQLDQLWWHTSERRKQGE